MSAILQGVYKRALQGNASSADGKAVGSFAEWFADRAWEIVNSTDSLSVRTLHIYISRYQYIYYHFLD